MDDLLNEMTKEAPEYEEDPPQAIPAVQAPSGRRELGRPGMNIKEKRKKAFISTYIHASI